MVYLHIIDTIRIIFSMTTKTFSVIQQKNPLMKNVEKCQPSTGRLQIMNPNPKCSDVEISLYAYMTRETQIIIHKNT